MIKISSTVSAVTNTHEFGPVKAAAVTFANVITVNIFMLVALISMYSLILVAFISLYTLVHMHPLLNIIFSIILVIKATSRMRIVTK